MQEFAVTMRSGEVLCVHAFDEGEVPTMLEEQHGCKRNDIRKVMHVGAALATLLQAA